MLGRETGDFGGREWGGCDGTPALDWGAGHTDVYNCPNSFNCTLKMSAFYCMEIMLQCNRFKIF